MTGLLALFFLKTQYQIFENVSFAVFVVFSIGLGSLIFLNQAPAIFQNMTHNKLPRVLRQLLESWMTLKKDALLVRALILLTLGNTILVALITYWSFGAIGIEVPFVKVLYLSCVTSFAALINITPGAIGIVEGMMLFVAKDLGFQTSQILMISMINRLMSFLVLVFATPLAVYYLFGGDWRSFLKNAWKAEKEADG